MLSDILFDMISEIELWTKQNPNTYDKIVFEKLEKIKEQMNEAIIILDTLPT